MNHRFTRCALAATVALLTLAAAAGEPVQIDVLLPMTGFGGFIGQGASQGLEAAEAVVNKAGGINGRPIKFVVHDDQSSPQVALQLANEIIAKKPSILMGAAFAAQCNAIAPLVSSGPVLYCITPSIHPAPGGYVFSIDPATADQVPVTVRYFRLKGFKRFAVISSTDASGQDAEHSLDAALALPENSGVTIVDREHFATTDISVAAQMARIKASNAQLLIAYTSGTPFGTVLRDAQSAGLTLPILTGNANMTLAQMTQYANILPSELYFAGFAMVVPKQIADRKLRDAVATYDSTLRSMGAHPEYMQSSAYDPALIVAAALRKLGPDASPSAIRDFIANLRDFDGAAGVYDFRTFPQRGLGQSSVLVVRWDKGASAWVAVSKGGGAPL